MIKIRLARLGRKKRPFYRVVAINSRSPRDGKFLEILGTYDPLQEPSEFKINKERLDDWVKKGAQLSNRLQKLTDPDKYADLVKNKPKRKPKKEVPVEAKEEAPAEEAPVEAKEEAPAEEAPVDTKEEAPAEEAPVEAKEEAPAEEAPVDTKEEAPAEETKE
jgi:small subunit ribosomal protein S16